MKTFTIKDARSYKTLAKGIPERELNKWCDKHGYLPHRRRVTSYYVIAKGCK